MQSLIMWREGKKRKYIVCVCEWWGGKGMWTEEGKKLIYCKMQQE